MNHEIDLNYINVRTDLAIDEINYGKYNIKEEYENIIVTSVTIDESNKNDFKKKIGNYITIEFNDITDYNNSKKVEKVFINELKKILKIHNIKDNDTCLVVGLGNEKSTPDSLGPLVINNIIVTNHFFKMGINVEEGFRSVCAVSPGVMGSTGIETSTQIKAIVDEVKPDFLIVIDSLKGTSTNRINKTIQITDSGISPGSGIGNNRKEISKDTINVPVIAVGIPTVVDIVTIVNDSINYMTNYYTYMKNNMNKPVEKLKVSRTNFKIDEVNQNDKKELFGNIGSLNEEELKNYIYDVLPNDNMIVTPKEIDFQIKKLSELISNGINNTLHKNVTDL